MGSQRSVINELIRNEVRLQMTPENQKNFASAVAVIPGFDYSKFLTMARGLEAEWTGTRSLTLQYELVGDAEIGELWPGKHNGWVVPEKPPDKSGRKRLRPARNRGYMLVMAHDDVDGKGSNKLSYCLETKELRIHLSLAFFNENLKFVDGKPPPLSPGKKLEFDIVTRAWVDRKHSEPWTEARALNHFGMM